MGAVARLKMIKLEDGQFKTAFLRSSSHFGNNLVEGLPLGGGSAILLGKCNGSPLRKSQYRLSQAQQVRSVASARCLRRLTSVSRFTASFVFSWPF
jgi:hypothetical protein